MPKLSDRLTQIAPSGTVAFFHRVREMIAAGRDIVDLSVGEPFFPTPPEVIEATCRALRAGHTRYGAVPGLAELRAAIGKTLGNIPTEQIMVTNGAKQALYQLFQAICSAGEAVIIPRPCWVSFPQQVRLAGAAPVFVDAPAGDPDPASLADAITDTTRAVLLNSPNNPTGAVYSQAFLEAAARLAEDHDLWVVFDAAYDQFLYDATGKRPQEVLSGISHRLALVGSFSKSYSMTGFRVGYAIGPPELITAMTTLQGHITGNVCTFAQHGALAALKLPAPQMADRRAALRQNRDHAVRVMRRFFDVPTPTGAFYLFADAARQLGPGDTAMGLADHLLAEAGVALVPGNTFGAPNHLRLSFAVSPETLNAGLARITKELA